MATSQVIEREKPNGVPVRGVLCALVSAVCFGLSGTVSKHLMEAYAFGPLWVAFVRMFGSSILFFIASLLVERGHAAAAVRSPKTLGALMAYGLCGVLFSQVGYLQAIDYTNSATATVLENCSLLFLLAYTCLARRKAPLPREAIAVALAFVGLFLLATGGDPTTMVLPPQGLAWGLSAGLATAIISIMPARTLAGLPCFTVNAFAMLAGSLAVLPVLRPWEGVPALDATGVLFLLFTVVVGTFGAYALYVQAAKDAGPLKAALLSTIEPLVALLASLFWLGQVFTVADLAGFALIMTMVFLMTR